MRLRLGLLQCVQQRRAVYGRRSLLERAFLVRGLIHDTLCGHDTKLEYVKIDDDDAEVDDQTLDDDDDNDDHAQENTCHNNPVGDSEPKQIKGEKTPNFIGFNLNAVID